MDLTKRALTITVCDAVPVRGRPAASRRPGHERASDTVSRVSVVETVLVFGVIPLGLYGLIAMLTLRERFARTPRYRPGQPWNYPPAWWTANPAGVGEQPSPASEQTGGAPRRTAKGGARGSW